MAREIVIDTDTVVGYNFLISKYYIENKGTITYRNTETQAKGVLDIVAPNHQVTLQNLQDLKDIYETLNALYYTWHDNGSFIKTVQFNTYEKNPLVLDAIRKKLYIMNTNLIFDLTLNESKEYRIDYIISYYKNHLGIAITTNEMSNIYDLIYSYYNTPNCYNEIDLTKLTNTPYELYYNNIYALNNFRELAKVVYSCTENPNNKYSKTNVAYIKGLDQTNKQIILTGTPNTNLHVGQQITISNLTVNLDGSTFSADGTYTLTNQSSNILTIKETLPFSYSYPYKKARYNITGESITAITRDNQTITLANNVPNLISVGDIISVGGTGATVEGQHVSADGDYTVISINANKIVVQEVLPCNFSGSGAHINKKEIVGNILKIEDNTVYLDKSCSVVQSHWIEVINENGAWEYSFQVASTTSSSTTITSSTSIPSYYPTYPLLQVDTPYPEILVDVTTSKNTEYPTGSFMVDNFSQCQAYISSYPNAVAPVSANHTNVNSQVPTTISVSGLPTLHLLGIYSKIYTGNN